MKAGLAQRLLTTCLALYGTVALIVTAGEIGFLSFQLRSELTTQIDTLGTSFSPPITLALWAFDDNQLQILVKTLAAHPTVGRVRIVDTTGSVLEKSTPVALGTPRTFTLVYIQAGRATPLGTLSLEPSMTLVNSQLSMAFVIATVRTVVLVALLSLILVIVVRRQVGSPLKALASQVSVVKPQDDGHRSLTLDSRTGDELKRVAEAFNQLLGDFRRTILSLDNQRAQLRTLLDTLPDLVWLKDQQGVYLACNRRFEAFFGASEAEILGKTDFDFVAADRANAIGARDAEVLITGRSSKREEEIEFASDGHREFLETIMTPVHAPDGRVIGVLGIGRDITERRLAEVERERLLRELRQSHKLESLGTLAGGLAHEMNNVLAVVLGLASLHHLNADPESRLYRDLETMIRAADRGGNLVRSLLSFARQNPIQEQEIQLNETIQAEWPLFDRITESKVHLRLDLAADLAKIRGDPAALVSAVLNLCGNAVDAMPDGGTLTIRTANREGGMVELTVEDTGTGMSAEVLEKATDPFFTTKEVGKGTGLGLPFVDSTVRSHGGTLQIRSVVGQGTTVSLFLPMAGAEPNLLAASNGAAHPAPSPSRQILIVDDDDLVRESSKELVSALGHHATLASSGEAALSLLETGWRPDLVILDKNMPGLGGRATLVRIRTSDKTLPVLLASGQIDQSTLEFAEADPSLFLIEKPFTIADLRLKIIAALRSTSLG